jgi:hypothetical protein
MMLPLHALLLGFTPAPALRRATVPIRSLRVDRLAFRAMVSTAVRVPLFDFERPDAAEVIESAFERIDDVIMGGVSSSRLVAAGDKQGGALFEGRIREQGGGFAGQRMKLLSTPLDLSSSDGLYLDVDASEADASARVWKVALRTRQDRGEVVYQAPFVPNPQGRGILQLPFSEFRLVRGPRLVAGEPPLTAAQTNETYQISLVASKFTLSDDGAPLEGFREGPFCLRVYKLGTYTATPLEADGGGPSAATLPRPMTPEEQAASTPPLLRLLRPLLSLLFGEAPRRRRAATLLLKQRPNSTAVSRARLAWAWRTASVGWLVAARRTASICAAEAAALALSLPVRLLFKLVFTAVRIVKLLKKRLSALPPRISARLSALMRPPPKTEPA